MSKATDYSFRIKLFLLGDCRVGKTSFINRICNNKFQDYVTTLGCDIQIKEHYLKDGTKIMVDIWDTAGQERFKSLTKTMVKNADGIVLMYDVTDKNSFSNISNWMKDIVDIVVDEVKVMIIGNKCEMDKERLIFLEQGSQVAQGFNALFYEVSCKNNINIEKAFNAIVNDIGETFKPLLDNKKLMIEQQAQNRKCCG